MLVVLKFCSGPIEVYPINCYVSEMWIAPFAERSFEASLSGHSALALGFGQSVRPVASMRGRASPDLSRSRRSSGLANKTAHKTITAREYDNAPSSIS